MGGREPHRAAEGRNRNLIILTAELPPIEIEPLLGNLPDLKYE